MGLVFVQWLCGPARPHGGEASWARPQRQRQQLTLMPWNLSDWQVQLLGGAACRLMMGKWRCVRACVRACAHSRLAD